MTGLGDADARRRALDPARSVIVQAPAGSGKTGLLIQRLLALLATVDRPEEVIAITFTRKATGEVRERVLDALAAARSGDAPAEPHARTTWALARAVVERDTDRGWGIERQPARLRILTIDALCAWLARHLVLRSGLPGDGAISDDPEPLYAEAAVQTLAEIDAASPWAGTVATVLEHLDNDASRLRKMLVAMLARRDQWLRLLGAPGRDAGRRRALLEDALARVVANRLSMVRAVVPDALAGEVVAVCAYAGAQLADTAPAHAGAACAGMDRLPGTSSDALALWQGIAAVLLTAAGDPRRKVDVRDGFPRQGPVASQMKARAIDLCAALGEVHELRVGLAECRALPSTRYSDSQWAVLAALLDTLQLAAAALKLVFAERGEHDHAEMAGAARFALGTEDAPSDLALALDYRIRHLLVDEFQDTSHAQFELLYALTAGWVEGDGRTLFLVGDPMQSIYRFREADVGLFEHAAQHGIGQVRLEPLALEANFRSRPAIIDWVNRRFPEVLGVRDDPTTGAVAFRASSPVREHAVGSAVCAHLLRDVAPAAEARKVVELAGAALAADAGASVAILVRSRSHLGALLPALRAAGIACRGVDIEPLAASAAVRDLTALVSAALDPLDRASWLAVLRAPWCGLSLADLLLLVDDVPAAVPVGGLLEDPIRLERIAAHARTRIERVREPLLDFAARARRGRLARGLEALWQALGGPALVDGEGRDSAERLLELVHRIEPLVIERGVGELHRQVGALFADPGSGERAVEVMTMHKAKGLEFDTVILPGLSRPPPGEQRALIEWARRADGPEGSDLLLAPLPSARGEEPALYDYIRRLEGAKSEHEAARVLYVAATRARETLHLVATLGEEDGSARRPPARSLLTLLWDGLGEEAKQHAPLGGPRGAVTAPLDPLGLDAGPRRVPEAWTAPPPPPPISPGERLLPEGDDHAEPVEFDWAGRLARHVGTVVHAALREIASDGIACWNYGRLRARRPAFAAQLRALGMSADEARGGALRVERTLSGVFADSRAKWILDPAHRDAASELSLAGIADGALVRGVVDRTFLDAHGTRWVIDYKTGSHEGGSLDEFLDREQLRYRAQLERYGSLLHALYGNPVRLALYYPALGGWREWASERTGSRP